MAAYTSLYTVCLSLFTFICLSLSPPTPFYKTNKKFISIQNICQRTQPSEWKTKYTAVTCLQPDYSLPPTINNQTCHPEQTKATALLGKKFSSQAKKGTNTKKSKQHVPAEQQGQTHTYTREPSE